MQGLRLTNSDCTQGWHSGWLLQCRFEELSRIMSAWSKITVYNEAVRQTNSTALQIYDRFIPTSSWREIAVKLIKSLYCTGTMMVEHSMNMVNHTYYEDPTEKRRNHTWFWQQNSGRCCSCYSRISSYYLTHSGQQTSVEWAEEFFFSFKKKTWKDC